MIEFEEVEEEGGEAKAEHIQVAGQEVLKHQPKHVRPRVRSRKIAVGGPATTKEENCGGGDRDLGRETAAVIHKQQQKQQQKQEKQGILKVPKYTKSLADKAASKAAQVAAWGEEEDNNNNNNEDDAVTVPGIQTAAVEPAVKGLILERKVQRRKNKRSGNITKVAAAQQHSIEGYIPKTVLNKNKNNNNKQENKSSAETHNPETEEDMILKSLADLMIAARTLPDQKNVDLGKEGTVVEAELNFSVMSPEEFEETIRQQDEGEVDAIDPVDPAVKEDQDEEVETVDNSDDESEKENSDVEGSFLDLMDGDHDEDEPTETRPERAFLQLWKALSQWVTPEAVSYVVQQHRKALSKDEDETQQQPPPSTTNWSDIESSRCAGLMSLLQLYLRSCIQDDLHRSIEERRAVEQSLGHMIRCFEYSRPSPKLGASQARALTCILVQTIRPDFYDDSDNPSIPASCAAVGLNAEEYKYLVKSAIVNFKPLP